MAFVGAGMPGDYEGRDVGGKIVISDGLAMPGKALAAERAGAIGQIHINDEHIHEMCISPVWGTPIPETGAQCDTSALDRIQALGKRYRITGTPGLVFEDGRKQAGAMNTEQIEKQLVASRKSPS